MATSRFPWMLMVLLVSPALVACGGDDACSPAQNRCEGNVAWVCRGEGDDATWATEVCGESTTCIKGTCHAGDVMACPPEDIGSWRCDLAYRYPGRCTEDGYVAWDLSQDCAPPVQMCAMGLAPEGYPGRTVAACVMAGDAGGICTAGISHPVCNNDFVTDCTVVSKQGLVQDCAAEGKVCSDGACQ